MKSKKSDSCCTCGQPRGLSPLRSSWGLNCPTVTIPRTGNPEHHPWQIHNDVIYNAAVWRNGGSDEDTYLCDECIRIGLRLIKLEVDKLLGVIESGCDKDAEIASLNERLGSLQFHHQALVYEHNRMQSRLASLLSTLPASETEMMRHARWEVERGPAKTHQ